MTWEHGEDATRRSEALAGPHVRAVIAAPVALRAAGPAWIRHWELLLAPVLADVGGEIVSAAMGFTGAELLAVGPDPIAVFRAVVGMLDGSPEARDYLTRVELVGGDAATEDWSYQKRPRDPAPG